MHTPTARRHVTAVLAVLVAVVLVAPAGSEEDRFGRSRDMRAPESRTAEKQVPDRIGRMPTSERDPVAELRAELAQLRARADALEQENAALASRLAVLEGVVSVSGSRVTIQSAGKLEIQAARIEAEAATSQFSGTVKAPTVLADTVSAKTMTPAAGNVW